jgi:hypothetical protein
MAEVGPGGKDAFKRYFILLRQTRQYFFPMMVTHLDEQIVQIKGSILPWELPLSLLSILFCDTNTMDTA